MWLKTLLRLALFGGVVVLLNACSNAASEAEAVDNKVPQTVNAQPKDTEVVITWEPVPDAERYIVCWAYVPITDCDANNPKIVRIDPNPAITEARWAHKGITNSTKYFYAVIAVLPTIGESALSANVSGVPEGIRPPTVVSISAHDNTATISWPEVPDATGYKLYMATEPDVKRTDTGLAGYMSHDVPVGALSYQHLGLNYGTRYYFIITALKQLTGGEIVESYESQEVIVIPGAYDVVNDTDHLPTDFKMTPEVDEPTNMQIVKEYVTFNWTLPSVANNNIYNIYWSTVAIQANTICDGSSVICKDADTTFANYVDNLQKGEMYYFAVKVSYPDPVSSNQVDTNFSSVVGFRAPGVIPPSVAPLISATAGNGLVTISVDEYDGSMLNGASVDGIVFNLYMVLANNFDPNGNKILDASNFTDDAVWGMKHSNIPAQFIHFALPNDKAFYFVVAAENAKGEEGPVSTMAIATPTAP